MTGRSISASALHDMSGHEREEALARLVEEVGRPNGELAALEDQIREYEIRYEISSMALLDELRLGRRRETADISKWLFLFAAKERLGKQARA